jgi:ABC-type multidrug transport system fused ATPase/permease subunit
MWLCGLGCAAIAGKAVGAVGLAVGEAMAAGSLGMSLRRCATVALLDRGASCPPPDALAQLAVGVRELEKAAVAGLVTELRAAVQLVPLAAALIFVSPVLAACAAVALIPFSMGLALIRRRWKTASGQAHRLAERLYAGIDELVRHLDLWRVYGAGDRVTAALEQAGRQAASASVRADSGRAALSSGNELLGALGLMLVITLAPKWGGALGDGTLVAFSAVFFMAYRPLRDLGDARGWLARGTAAARSLGPLLSAREPPACAALASADQPLEHARDRHRLLELRATAFGARGFGPRTSFTLEPGKIVALVGPTGSGKTTLLRTLLGLEASAGDACYGGRPLRPGVGPAHRPMAWVPQEAPLITGTLYDNLTLCGATRERAAEALRQIGAGALELGLAGALVGPGGRSLSGGERRQVALARAIASGLPVLLVDEPTEGLDAESAEAVLGALRRIRGERSVLVVTHRAEVVALADEVVHVGNVTGTSELGARSELRQEPRVVLEEDPDIGHLVAQHG